MSAAIPIRRAAGPSPEREHLGEAITRHREAVGQVTRLEEAQRRGRAASSEAFAAIGTAEAVLAEARENAPHNYVAALLDGTDDTADPVTAAEQRLADARRRRETARQGDAMIEGELRSAASLAAIAASNLRTAVGAVVAASPEVTKLVADHRAAKLRVVTLTLILAELSRHNALPAAARYWDATNPVDGDPAAAVPWSAALAALQGDAGAALPDPDDA